MKPSFDEVARATNPAGAIDAVLVEVNSGATTSFGYSVFVVPTGSQVSKRNSPAVSLYAAVRSEQAYGADLRWVTSSNLLVEFQSARIAKLDLATTNVAEQRVTITLRSNVVNRAAPPGGMLFNLEKARERSK